MSYQDISAPAPVAVPVTKPTSILDPYPFATERLWLHLLLLLLTLLTTSAVGARMQSNFERNLPPFDIDRDLAVFVDIWSQPAVLLHGLPFSLTLMIILLVHEFGHYIACVFYRIDASLPYFLPAPTFTGTLGAFIRIRSAIYSKRALFDIGIAGPIAGFVFLLPALTVGLALSKELPGIGTAGSLTFGTPPVLRFFELLIFPGVGASDIYLHPIARAAWVGLLATALNLLPAGQLDGGHIVYAIAGERHKLITRLFLICLLPLGYLWHGWWVWAVLLFVFGRKHPAIFDEHPLRAPRYRLAVLALAIFLVSFTLVPVDG